MSGLLHLPEDLAHVLGVERAQAVRADVAKAALAQEHRRHRGVVGRVDDGDDIVLAERELARLFVRDAYFTCSVSMYLTSALMRFLTDAVLPLAAKTSPHTGMSGPPWPRTAGLRPSISS